MLKKTWLIIAVTLICILCITACDPNAPGTDFTTKSGEASLKSITFDGITLTENDIKLDPAAKSLTVTLPPVNLESLTHSITVSENATFSAPEKIKDGEEFDVTVTAQDGTTTATWKVTVNVGFGMSYKIGNTRYILSEGIYHSKDEEANSSWGNNTPSFVHTPPVEEGMPNYRYTAVETGIDMLFPPTFLENTNGGFLYSDGKFHGIEHSNGLEEDSERLSVNFIDRETGEPIIGNEFKLLSGEITNEQGSILIGSFYGKGEFFDGENNNEAVITEGFMKLLYILPPAPPTPA